MQYKVMLSDKFEEKNIDSWRRPLVEFTTSV